MAHTPRHIDVEIKADASSFIAAMEQAKAAFLAFKDALGFPVTPAPEPWRASSWYARSERGSAAVTLLAGLAFSLTLAAAAWYAVAHLASLTVVG